MSRIFKSFTDNINHLTGWYREHKNDDDVVLRLSNNNAEHPGTLRFNNSTQNPVFQGFNGNNWVDFNATKGDKGDKGTDFNEIIRLQNIEPDIETDGTRNSGCLFPQNIETLPDNTIPIRKIQGGMIRINEEIKPSILVRENPDAVVITSMPRPHIWDFSNIDVASIKSKKEEIKFKAFGTVNKYQVAQDEVINKGQLVCLTLLNNKICIKGLKDTQDIVEFIDNIQVVGIALEDKLEGQSCCVCTEGVTTVKVSRNSSDNFINDNDIKFGSIGLLNNKGMISKALVKPKGEFKRIGYFMEDMNIGEGEYQYCLFNVKL